MNFRSPVPTDSWHPTRVTTTRGWARSCGFEPKNLNLDPENPAVCPLAAFAWAQKTIATLPTRLMDICIRCIRPRGTLFTPAIDFL